jgi:hypothetical protein
MLTINVVDLSQVLAGKNVDWRTVRAFVIFGTLVTGIFQKSYFSEHVPIKLRSWI